MNSYLSTLTLKARERLIIHTGTGVVETVMEIKCLRQRGVGGNHELAYVNNTLQESKINRLKSFSLQ